MPQVRDTTRSKIPVVGQKPTFFPSKKSENENVKPEVKNKQRHKVKISKPVPAAPDGEKRRHLSVVDTNTREGSKSSVSDLEGDVFHTAPKERIAERPKGGRIYAKSSKEKQDEKPRSGKIAKPCTVSEVPIENTSTTFTTSLVNFNFPEIKVEPEHQEPLPDGVINIEVDAGLYEYNKEVVVYLRVLEVADSIPVGFLDEGSMTPNMRSILVDWIIQVQHHLKLCQETLYLGIAILDMVLHRRDVDPDKLQLVGVTALLVASKLEEYYPVNIKKLLHLTENSYSRLEVTHMERTVLDVMKFQVYLPSPQVFLLRFARAAFRSDDPEFLKTCQYLMDTHLPLPSHPCLPPSLLAAAAVAAPPSSTTCRSTPPSPRSPSGQPPWSITPTTTSPCSCQPARRCWTRFLQRPFPPRSSRGRWSSTRASQHQRLVLANHLTVDVLKRASLVLIRKNLSQSVKLD